MAAQNYEGASIFWLRRMAALDGEEAAIEHWQIKRFCLVLDKSQ
jgi:hypothetical protein